MKKLEAGVAVTLGGGWVEQISVLTADTKHLRQIYLVSKSVN